MIETNRAALALSFVACSRVCSSDAHDAAADAPAEAIAEFSRCVPAAPPVHLADDAIEIGEGALFGNGVAIGANVHGDATMFIVGPSEPLALEPIALGVQDPNAPPPLPIADRADLWAVHVVPLSAQGARRIVVESVKGASMKREIPLAQSPSDDDVEIDAVFGNDGAVVWTFGDRIFLAPFASQEVLTIVPQQRGPKSGDISMPRVLKKKNGFLVAYLVTRSVALEAAAWYVDAPLEGPAERLAAGWVESVSVEGGKAGAPNAITSPSGRATAFDWIETRAGIEMVVKLAVGAGELAHLRVEDGAANELPIAWDSLADPQNTQQNTLVGGSPIALAAPDFLAAFADQAEAIHLFFAGKETRETAFENARPLAAAEVLAKDDGPKIRIFAVSSGGTNVGAKESVVRVLSCGR